MPSSTLRSKARHVKLTFLPFVIKACVYALKEHPRFNSSLDHTGENLIVKRGERGATIAGEDHPAVPGEVVDTTGAGDALAAGYLVGGPALAMEAAGRCVAQIGTMP